MRYRCGDGHFPRHLHRGLGHRARLHEGLRRHGDHSARHLLVGIDDVGDVGRTVDDGRIGGDVGGVEDLRDGLRSNHRVAAVDIVKVSTADRIRRLVNLARRQRKPAHGGRDGTAGSNGNLEVLAADKRHQRRRVHRPLAPRARHPAPGAVDVGPAAVVRNRVTPGRVVDPGPAPGVDPGPVAVPVRRPAAGHARRRPDVAIVRIGAPGAVGIEVFVADDVGRDVARRHRGVAAAVAFARPAVQIVVTPRRQGLVVGQAGAVETVPASGVDRVRRAFAVDLGLTALHHDCRGVLVGVDLDAVFAASAQREGEIGRRDFKGLSRPQAAHTHLQQPL